MKIYLLPIFFLGMAVTCAAASEPTTNDSVQVQINRHIRGNLLEPALQDYRRANESVARLLSRKVGGTVGCYIAPTPSGHSVVWVDVGNSALTAELREEIERVIRDELYGPNRASKEPRAEAKEARPNTQDKSP